MPGEILASSLVNKVSFKVDLSSYRTALKAIQRLKSKMGELNKSLAMPNSAQAQVKRATAKWRSNIEDAHVKARAQHLRNEVAANKKLEAEAKRSQTALDKVNSKARSAMFGAKVNQITGVSGRGKNLINSRTTMFTPLKQPIMGPSRSLFEQNQAAKSASAAAANVAARKETKIGITEDRFGFNTSKTFSRLKAGQVAAYRKELDLLGQSYRNNTITLGQYNNKVAQLTTTMRRANAENLTFVERVKSMRSGLLFASLTAGAVIANIAETGKQLENTGVMMGAVFGPEAANQMKYLRAESDRLGISFIDSAKDFAKLSFAGTKAGMSTQQMNDIFSSFAEAGKVYGMTTEQVSLSMNALTQMFG